MPAAASSRAPPLASGQAMPGGAHGPGCGGHRRLRPCLVLGSSRRSILPLPSRRGGARRGSRWSLSIAKLRSSMGWPSWCGMRASPRPSPCSTIFQLWSLRYEPLSAPRPFPPWLWGLRRLRGQSRLCQRRNLSPPPGLSAPGEISLTVGACLTSTPRNTTTLSSFRALTQPGIGAMAD